MATDGRTSDAHDEADLLERLTVANQFITIGSQGGIAAELDWQARAFAPGVVWNQPMLSAAEVNNFRRQNSAGGIAPNINVTDGNTRWISGDSVTPGHGCLEIFVPVNAGGSAGLPLSGWQRPFHAMFASMNGLPYDDPAAGGTVTRRNYNPNNPGAYNYNTGWYGHADYHSQSPGNFDGTEFYIQCCAKISANGFNAGNDDGKLFYIDHQDGGSQELIWRRRIGRYWEGYTAFGDANGTVHGPQGDRNAYNAPFAKTYLQPGSDPHREQCYWENRAVSPNDAAPNCWGFRDDQWCSYLFYVKCGHGNYDNIGNDYPNLYDVNSTLNKDSIIRAWAARPGQTSYTKLVDVPNFMFVFDSTQPKGWNQFTCSAYNNNSQVVQSWYHRYTDIIFSKLPIACPQVWAV